MSNRRMKLTWAAACLAPFAIAACGEGVLDESSPVSSQVRFDLGSVSTDAVDVCVEADSVSLVVDPASGAQQIKGRSLGAACSATFEVTVKKGQVQFTGLVFGNRRPLLAGTEPFKVERDGFNVVIRLHEIDALKVATQTVSGTGPEKYSFTVDRGPSGVERSDPIEVRNNADTTVATLAAGDRSVELDPTPCTVDRVSIGPTVSGSSPRITVSVTTDSLVVVPVLYELDCGGGGPPGVMGTGTLIVTTSTTGTSSGRYTVRVDGSVVGSVGPDDTQGFSVVAGDRDVSLGTPTTCQVLSANPMTDVSIPLNDTAQVHFDVDCPVTGSIRVTSSISGGGAPNAPCSVAVTGPGVSFPSLPVACNSPTFLTPAFTPGVYTLTFNAPGCTVQSPRTVTVSTGTVVTAAFQISCGTGGDLRVNVKTISGSAGAPTGPGGGYTFTVKDSSGQLVANPAVGRGSLGIPAAAIVPDLDVGAYDVELEEFDGCSVFFSVAPNPDLRAGAIAPLNVTSNGADVTFVVDCGPTASGRIQITTVSPGLQGSVDVELDGVFQTSMGVDAVVVLDPVTAGVRRIELTGVPPGCVRGTNPRWVVVDTVGTASELFEVGCTGGPSPNTVPALGGPPIAESGSSGLRSAKEPARERPITLF